MFAGLKGPQRYELQHFYKVPALIELHLTEKASYKHVSKSIQNSNQIKVLHCALCGVGRQYFIVRLVR
jgi:hypothetical protein